MKKGYMFYTLGYSVIPKILLFYQILHACIMFESSQLTGMGHFSYA